MKVHEPTRSLLLRSDDPFSIRDVLPSASRTLCVTQNFEFNVAVKHTINSTLVLRNLGLAAPSPIASYYDWPGPYANPFEHQVAMAEFATIHKRFFNLGEQGVGKTAASLWTADWLMKEGLVHRVLIITTISCLDRIWKTDLFYTLMQRTCAIAHGTLKKRIAALESGCEFIIINHDGISIGEVKQRLVDDPDIDLVIVDEGGEFRNHNTDKYRALEEIVRSRKRRLWWLTGTPCPQTPADVWAQCRLVDPRYVPPYYGQFRRKVMLKVSEYVWRPRADAYTLAYEAMQPAIRYAKADCLDLPPVTTEDRGATLTVVQAAAFKKMKNDMYLEDIRDQVAKPITAANAVDRLGKLRQILCGAIKRPDGTYKVIDHADRTKVLLESIRFASAKVIVIVPFKGIIKSLEAELIQAKYTVGLLNGDVTVPQRNTIIKAFKTKPDPHILLCHPQVMAHGLNLVEADTVVFYAPIYSNNHYRQVIERFNRTGQTRKMTIIRIGAHALDWSIYKMVDNRDETQMSILRLYQHIIHEQENE